MIVASDVEGTLTTGATWRGIGRYLLRTEHRLRYSVFFATRFPQYVLVKLGFGDEQRFKDRWTIETLRLLRHWPIHEIERMAEWIVEHELWPKRREAVLHELEQHQQQGRQIVLASGTYQPVLEAFARKFGASALGTALEVADGRFTGRISSAINTGSAKAASLRHITSDSALAAAYGDTLADVPMLELSATPVVVAPDQRLRHVAQTRGWRILDDQPATDKPQGAPFTRPVPESWRTRLNRWGFSLFPPYAGSGGNVTYIAADWHEVHVKLPLNWRTRNYVGTIFGGSMYAAIDPIYMMMLIKLLGRDYIVWDKAAAIRFKKPGRATLYARFHIQADELNAIKAALEQHRSIDRTYVVELVDAAGTVHATIDKIIYVRRKAAQT